MNFQIQTCKMLSELDKKKWAELLLDNSVAQIAITLCESLENSSLPNLEIYYLEIYSGDVPLALGLFHILKDHNLGSYIGGVSQTLFSKFEKFGWKPLRADLAFLETPKCNYPGLFFTPEGKQYETAILQSLVPYIQSKFQSDIFCIKTISGSNLSHAAHKSAQHLKMSSCQFLANMQLKFNFETFEQYKSSLPPRWREIIRRNQKKFASLGGNVTFTTELSKHASIALELFQLTDNYHKSKGHLGRPIGSNYRFFSALEQNSSQGKSLLFIAKIKEKPVGVFLVLENKETLFILQCGLDYQLSKQSRAYFALYYEVFRYAIKNRLTQIMMGAEAYDIKRRLGALSEPTSYHFLIKHKLIGFFARFLVDNFSGQKGAKISGATL